MKKLPIVAIFACGLTAGASLAQTQEQAPPPVMQQEEAEVSDADIEKFAEIYVDVESTRMSMTEELQQNAAEVDAAEAQVQLQEGLVAAIEDHGWSVDKYNRVATAISNDPEKRDKAVQLINDLVKS